MSSSDKKRGISLYVISDKKNAISLYVISDKKVPLASMSSQIKKRH